MILHPRLPPPQSSGRASTESLARPDVLVRRRAQTRARPHAAVFCTIATKARLGYCRALVTSLRRVHPESPVFALFLGGDQVDLHGLECLEGVRAISLDHLGLDSALLHGLQTSQLTNEEYLTCLQPWLLDWALEHGGGPVVFVADDFYILGSLSSLAERASAAGTVLVRRSPPLTQTTAATLKRLPEEPAIDSHLVGVGASGNPFLEAWKQEAYRAATTPGVSMELFMDGAADTLSVVIIDDPRYNLGWWNIAPNDPMGMIAGAGAGEVMAFHFHGFDFRRPYQIISRPDGWLPLRLSEHAWLAELCAQYAEAVRSNQLAEPRPVATTSEHDTGIRGDDFAMACWRRARATADIGRSAAPPDLTLSDDEALMAWLSSPSDGLSPVVSRYLMEVYRGRPDLQVTFPDLVENLDQFLHWARTYGRTELAVPGRHGTAAWPEVPSTRHPVAQKTLSRPHAQLGVNVIGLLGSHLGLGEAVRQTIEALRLAGISTRTHAIDATDAPALRHSLGGGDGDWFPVTLLQMNPPELLAFSSGIGQRLMARGYHIGLWVWETETIPADWRRALSLVDEIWVPSDWVRAAFVRETSLPVITIPHAVPRPWHPRYMDRRYLGLGEGFTFLSMCDMASSLRRKNVLGLVAAFSSAFSPDEGPRLIIKTLNGDLNVGDFEDLLLAVRDRPDIAVYDRVLSAYEKAALLDACDCFVSMHRAEGFGLPMAEAMLLAKPVIATGYSGNLAYMTSSNSYLLEFRREPVGVDWDRYPGDHVWADPDLHEARRVLRYVWEHQDEARERGLRAAKEVEAICSPTMVGAQMRAQIEMIWSRGLTSSTPGPLHRRPIVARVVRRLGRKLRSGLR